MSIASWWKNFRIPKTMLGLTMVGVAVAINNEMLLHAGLAILGVGVASKAVKASQGNPIFRHETHLINLFK